MHTLSTRINTVLLVMILIIGVAMVAMLATRAYGGPLDPPGPVGSTMRTLGDLVPSWNQNLSSNGGCSSPRFKCVLSDGAVLDNETGIVWERQPSGATYDWAAAHATCNGRVIGERAGWRLPTVQELASLADASQFGPALPVGHPFVSVPPASYWTSTVGVADGGKAVVVDMSSFGTASHSKATTHPVWCMRGAGPQDAYSTQASGQAVASGVLLTSGCCGGINTTPGDAHLVTVPDGANVASFPAAKVVGSGCKGGTDANRTALLTKIGATLPELPTAIVIDMESGATLAAMPIAEQAPLFVNAWFPCIADNGMAVSADRVVFQVGRISCGGCPKTFTVLDITTGQPLFSAQTPDQAGYAFWPTCSEDAVFYPVGTTNTNLVRLTDGAIIGTFPFADNPQYSVC